MSPRNLFGFRPCYSSKDILQECCIPVPSLDPSNRMNCIQIYTFRIPIQDEERTQLFFTLLCGTLKGFMKALKAFIKYFWGAKKKCENKIKVNFYFNISFIHEAERFTPLQPGVAFLYAMKTSLNLKVFWCF